MNQKKEMKDKIVKFLTERGREAHYRDIAYEIGLHETTTNTLCNEMVAADELLKPMSGWFNLPSKVDDRAASNDPWDMTPVTAKMVKYNSDLDKAMAEKFPHLDFTIGSEVLRHKYKAFRAAGIPFKEFEQ